MVVSYNFVNEILVLQSELHVVAFPIVVEEFVADFVFLFETQLDADVWKIFWLGHVEEVSN